MKRILLFLVMINSLVLGTSAFREPTVFDAGAQVVDILDSVGNFTTDTKSKIVADNIASNVLEDRAKNSIVIQDYENAGIKNNVDEKGGLKQSLYREYFTSGLKKEGVGGLFGINIINNATNTWVPLSINNEYLLGIGDRISVKIWSSLFSTEVQSTQILSLEIGKNGSIFIPELGSFQSNNKSINTLQNEILVEGRKKLKHFNVEITLEKIREISIFVLGEVNRPGQVVTTPYNNILNVLNRVGGVTGKASLRKIKIIRDNKEINVDLYDYFLGTKKIEELKLRDGDTLIIPMAKDLVVIQGEVKKPAIYEVNEEKDYLSLINLAGGLGKLADKALIQGYFIQDGKITIESIKIDQKIKNNVYRIDVNKIDETDRNNIYLLGAVVNPGIYAFEKGIKFKDLLQKSGGITKESTESFGTIIRGRENKTVINFDLEKDNPELQLEDEVYIYSYKDVNTGIFANIQGAVVNQGSYTIYEGTKAMNLIYSARGLKESVIPYMNRADLFRIDENGKLKVYKLDLNKLMAGDENENILIKRNDVLKIYTYEEVIRYDDVYIYGEVREPGRYRYYENMTVEDLVFYSKGLKLKADSNIVVVRNDINNKKETEFVIDIERNPDFRILERDVLFVRKKAEWEETKLVKIEGFVKYPGTYHINPKETMASLLERVGGFKEEAFPAGIKFNRGESKQAITNFEYNEKSNSFVRDIELMDGDTIYVPQKSSVVKVEGEVYLPSYIVYDKEMKNYEDYIEAAGGYKESAYKKRVFVVKANGKAIDKPKKAEIEPGDMIYVPLDTRTKKGFEKFMDNFKGTLEIVSSVALIILLF